MKAKDIVSVIGLVSSIPYKKIVNLFRKPKCKRCFYFLKVQEGYVCMYAKNGRKTFPGSVCKCFRAK